MTYLFVRDLQIHLITRPAVKGGQSRQDRAFKTGDEAEFKIVNYGQSMAHGDDAEFATDYSRADIEFTDGAYAFDVPTAAFKEKGS